MTLRMEQVAAQLPSFLENYRRRLADTAAGLELAERALAGWAEDRAAGDAAIQAAMQHSPEPYALSFGERPDAGFGAPAPGPVVVVAADGSSIEPDRWAAASCYVINAGFVVLPYGLDQDPEAGSIPEVGPPVVAHDGRDDSGAEERTLRGWGVNLRRDARELEVGARYACDRVPAGPVVLLLDGTLFPWDLDSRQVSEPTREEVRARTQAALDSLAQCGANLSMGAYISGSRSADVVTSLRALSGGGGTAWPLGDAQLFARLLGDGERSAIFRASSQRTRRVESMFSPSHQVCFFYLRAGDDLARVELPHWVAEEAERVDRLQATLVDQCRRCDGYPRALQEAHEQAVISAGDRLQFSSLLDRLSRDVGLRAPGNGKSMSKRRRAL